MKTLGVSCIPITLHIYSSVLPHIFLIENSCLKISQNHSLSKASTYKMNDIKFFSFLVYIFLCVIHITFYHTTFCGVLSCFSHYIVSTLEAECAPSFFFFTYITVSQSKLANIRISTYDALWPIGWAGHRGCTSEDSGNSQLNEVKSLMAKTFTTVSLKIFY